MQDIPGKPKTAKAKTALPQSREDRLKAALKANMARRKAQAKTRAGAMPATEIAAQAHNDKEDE